MSNDSSENITFSALPDNATRYAPSSFISPFDLLKQDTDFGKDNSGLLLSDKVWKPYFESYFPDKEKDDSESFKEAFVRTSREILKQVTINPNVLAGWTRLLNDKTFMLAAVQQCGWVLRYASDELKNDKDVVLAAVQQRGSALYYASDELKNDKDVVLAAVQQEGWALQYASDELKNDKDVVLAAVQQEGWALQYASDELKNDKDVVLAVVQKDGWALEYASGELKNDKKVVLVAVQQEGWALQYASDELKNDKKVVLAAVQQCGSALEYASDELKNDKTFMLAAVQQDGWALQYASDELKNDKEFMLATVQQDGRALRYASDELKNDKEFILAAMKQGGRDAYDETTWTQRLDPLVPLAYLFGGHTYFCLNALSTIALTFEGALMATGIILTATAFATANPALAGIGLGVGFAGGVMGSASLGFFCHTRRYSSILKNEPDGSALSLP